MKAFARSILVALLLLIAVPAYSAPGMQVVQIFNCEFNDDATADQVLKLAEVWLSAAKDTKGGSNIVVAIRFPIAEGAATEGDFRFVISTPTFAEWGAFTDAYEGSAVSKVDEQLFDLADCGASTLWEGMVMK